jgi:hypothetical protein
MLFKLRCSPYLEPSILPVRNSFYFNVSERLEKPLDTRFGHSEPEASLYFINLDSAEGSLRSQEKKTDSVEDKTPLIRDKLCHDERICLRPRRY